MEVESKFHQNMSKFTSCSVHTRKVDGPSDRLGVKFQTLNFVQSLC